MLKTFQGKKFKIIKPKTFIPVGQGASSPGGPEGPMSPFFPLLPLTPGSPGVPFTPGSPFSPFKPGNPSTPWTNIGVKRAEFGILKLPHPSPPPHQFPILKYIDNFVLAKK